MMCGDGYGEWQEGRERDQGKDEREELTWKIDLHWNIGNTFPSRHALYEQAWHFPLMFPMLAEHDHTLERGRAVTPKARIAQSCSRRLV